MKNKSLIRKRHKDLILGLLVFCMLISLLPYSSVGAETVPISEPVAAPTIEPVSEPVVAPILEPVSEPVAAPEIKKYSIVFANEKGYYTYCDLNEGSGKAKIEISDAGNIMIPLKKLCTLMPGITYSYNSKKKEATVTNTFNGRKLVYHKNSKYCYYYASKSSKSTKKPMAYKMYVSETTSSVMVHMSSLKWVMGTTGGYQYYKVKDMQKAGYDTTENDGLIAYNPFMKINGIPKASNVTGISETVKVTIPEGYSVAQIFDLLVKKGVCASTDLLYDAMENYDYSYYPLVNEIEENENRCFRLEGYLFPDTYEFKRLSKGQDAIGKFLRNTEIKITDEDRKKAESQGYSVNEILTIASLIQKEIGDPKQMPLVSSVIINRLEKPMQIELDASFFYLKRYLKPYIGGDINRYNSYYDTYICAALPAGPICNPGKDAIRAALNPAETNYLFFHSDEEGNYHFSETL